MWGLQKGNVNAAFYLVVPVPCKTVGREKKATREERTRSTAVSDIAAVSRIPPLPRRTPVAALNPPAA